jgi:hypothetical protein
MLLLSLTFSSNNTSAVTATVYVRFDYESMEYTLGANDSNVLIVNGNLVCEVRDLIEGYQYVKVYLYAEENNGWAPTASPGVARFYESGIVRMNASILIPHNAYNGTLVKLVVFGSWIVEPQGERFPGSSGSVESDTINITVIRPPPASIEDIYEEGSEGSGTGLHLFGFPLIIFTVFLPIVCVILISYYAVKRKKRKKEKMDN